MAEEVLGGLLSKRANSTLSMFDSSSSSSISSDYLNRSSGDQIFL